MNILQAICRQLNFLAPLFSADSNKPAASISAKDSYNTTAESNNPRGVAQLYLLRDLKNLHRLLSDLPLNRKSAESVGDTARINAAKSIYKCSYKFKKRRRRVIEKCAHTPHFL